MVHTKQTHALKKSIDLYEAFKLGLLAGVIATYVSLIGMVVTFSERDLIANGLTLGQVLLVSAPLGVAYYMARKDRSGTPGQLLLFGGIIGFVTTLPLLGLISLAEIYPAIRQMFVNISPNLVNVLTFGQDSVVVGSVILLGTLMLAGVAGAGLRLIPPHWRKALVTGIGVTLGIALMSELLIINILRRLIGSEIIRLFFRGGALRWYTAVAIFLIAFGSSIFWQMKGDQIKARYHDLGRSKRKTVRRSGFGLGGFFLLALPWLVGTFLSDVLDNVGLYILMGLGLNIAVGLAGLLDLGYLTNYAVGAYTCAVLTTTGIYGGANLSFWLVIPIALLAAMLTGFILALPVLRMRGDYLAIATLGFGEIIRVLALSDWLAPYIGGPQGILEIPNPTLFGFAFSRPEHFYYIILLACLVALFVSVRLNNSRTGRQWMALREDEDVAAAMGIDTVLTKLLAFTLSAAAGGVAGAIFAVKLGTVFPQSFNILVSINVLSIIIVGGMGSIPGIVLGAFLLVGAPELLREFQEYRLLMYGALLILVMLVRPEGLWPSAVRRRELYDAMEEGGDVPVPPSEDVSRREVASEPTLD